MAGSVSFSGVSGPGPVVKLQPALNGLAPFALLRGRNGLVSPAQNSYNEDKAASEATARGYLASPCLAFVGNIASCCPEEEARGGMATGSQRLAAVCHEIGRDCVRSKPENCTIQGITPEHGGGYR